MTEPVITITLPAPVETVWDAFRDFEQVREWHGWETEGGEGSLDDEIRLIYGEGVIASEMPGPWRAAARDENLAPGLAVLGSAWCCRARLRD